MRNIIRTLVAVVRGGNEPREVAAAVFLGILAGFLTGWNASLAIVCLLVLILNATTRVFCQTWLLGAAVSWLLTPLTFHVGYFLIERTRIGDGVAAARDSLFLVLFDLDRYTLVGGLVAGLAIAAPLVWLTFRSVKHLHRELLLSRYPLEIPREGQDSIAGFPLALCRFFYGRPTQARLVVSRPAQTRRARAITTGSIAFLSLAAMALGGPELIESRLLSRMAQGNGAEVTAASTRLSLVGGTLQLQDLRIADPEHSDRDLLQVGYVTAIVRPGPLLRGDVRIERLLLEDLRSDAPRDLNARRGGEIFDDFRPKSVEIRAEAPETGVAGESLAGLPLDHLVQDWRTFDRRALRLRTLIEHIERLAAVETPSSDSENSADITHLGYADMRRMRGAVPQQLPGVIVGALRARALPADWGLGDGAELEITNLSSNPALTGQPTRISILAPESGAEATIEMNLHRGGRKHLARCRVESRNLPAVVNTAQVGRVVAVHGGRAILTAEGWVSLERIDLPVELELVDLSATVLPGQAPAGVTAESWNNALSSLAALNSSAVVEGSWHAPRVVIDAWQVADKCRRQLTALGKHDAAGAFEVALEASHPSQYSPTATSAERVASQTVPADELDPALDEFVAEPQSAAVERPHSQQQPVAQQQPGSYRQPGGIEQPNQIPADFAEPAPNPNGLGGLRPDADAPDSAEPEAAATATFDPEASEPVVKAAPVVRDRGELRYPVTVDRGAAQAAANHGNELVQDLRSSRRVQPRLSNGTLLRLPGEPSPPPPATDNAPRVDDFDHDVVTRLPAETHVTPPPVGFEIGYDDEPVQDRPTAQRAPARNDVSRNGSPDNFATNNDNNVNEGKRNRPASSPKVVQPYWPEEGQPKEGETRLASTFGSLADGFKSMFASPGRKTAPPANGNEGNQANNNDNGGNNDQQYENDSTERSSPTGEFDEYNDNSFTEQEPSGEEELPGMINERQSPQHQSQPQRQAERTQRSDDQWYRFWR